MSAFLLPVLANRSICSLLFTMRCYNYYVLTALHSTSLRPMIHVALSKSMTRALWARSLAPTDLALLSDGQASKLPSRYDNTLGDDTTLESTFSAANLVIPLADPSWTIRMQKEFRIAWQSGPVLL